MQDHDKARTVQRATLLQFIKKIPIFSNLRDPQAVAILLHCNKLILEKGGILCMEGDDSTSMYILLQGELVVKLRDSTVVTKITPISSIGEMGVFTGEPRTATVEATANASLLSLRKDALDLLIDKDPKLGVRIMQKVIEVLSERIANDNERIRQFQNYIVSHEGLRK